MKKISFVLKSIALSAVTTVVIFIGMIFHLFMTAPRDVEGTFSSYWGLISYDVILDDPYIAELLSIGPGYNVNALWILMIVLFIGYYVGGIFYGRYEKSKTENSL